MTGRAPLIRFQSEDNPVTHTLTIEQGLSAGAECLVGPDWLVVGTGMRDDIRLFDDGVESAHFALRAEGRRIAIRAGAAASAGIGIEGEGILEPGAQVRLPLPVRLQIGGAAIRIDRQVADAPPSRLAGLTLQFLRRAAPLPLSAAFVFGTANPTFTANTPPAAPVVAEAPPPPAPPPPRGDAAVEALDARLASAGLGGVSVAWEEGTLRLSGALTETGTAPLAAVLGQFDAETAGQLVIRNEIGSDPAGGRLPPTPRIGAVWRGAEPYITVGEGRYGVEAMLPGGWQVVEIGEQGVVLAFGGRRVAVSF